MQNPRIIAGFHNGMAGQIWSKRKIFANFAQMTEIYPYLTTPASVVFVVVSIKITISP